MSLLVDPKRARDRDGARSRSDKRIRSMQEARPKDTYYRKEYGWIMSDADVAKEGEVKGQYDKAVKDTQANIAKARGEMNNAVAQGRGDINGAYDDGISGIQRGSLDLVPVRVVNGNTVEHTYHVPRTYAQDFAKTEGLSTAWFNDDSVLNVEVNVDGGRVVGKELHTALGDAATQVKQYQTDSNKAYDSSVANANTERSAQLKAYDAANAKSIAGAEQRWNTELTTAKNAYGNRVAGGKKQYEDSKKDYSDSVMGMDEGLLESRTSRVNPNAGGNKK